MATVAPKPFTPSLDVKKSLTARGWSVPKVLPNTAWMHKGDTKQLEKVLTLIDDARTRNTLPADQQEMLLAQLLQRSPKKTGTLFEVVERHMHQFAKGRDVSHDALHGNDRIEIKGSRVITQKNAVKATNLFECLLGEERYFAPVKEALTLAYDCNIQQVKCRSFERILYCLYFADVIVECEMTAAQLQAFIDDKTTGVCGHVKAGMLSDAAGITVGAAKRMAAEKAQLAYSDFQHAGNEGEGQFHIKPANVLYHLVRHCKNVYSYSEFADVLKAQKV